MEKFLTESLTSLQVEYVDLYLIHLPVGFQDKGDGNLWPTDETGAFCTDPSTDHISLWKVSTCSTCSCSSVLAVYIKV